MFHSPFHTATARSVRRAASRGRWALFGALLAALGGASCTSSQAYRQALDERDLEINKLREERASLKRDRQGLLAQIDALSVQLREASAEIESRPEPQAASQPGLDSFGIGYGYRDGLAVISIPSSVTFGSGRAELSKDGRRALQEVARVLREQHGSGVYHIEGHTDTDPIKKSKFATNRDLSLARAMAVLHFLVADCRIPDEQCVIVGHGEYRPVDPRATNEAKARNRRVEIVVHSAAP